MAFSKRTDNEMIETILIKNEASFDEAGQRITDLKKINFIYGANGTGKTTISRIIDDQSNYSDCNISWQGGNELQTLVYNRDFVNRNFNSNQELKGVFTLGEQEAGITTAIETAKKELDTISQNTQVKNTTLRGDNGEGGKLLELKTLESEFMDQCWLLKIKYNDDFKGAFLGVRDKKEKFKTRLLKEAVNNKATLLSFEELKEKARTIFADDLTKELPIPSLLYSDLTALENTAILTKKVIGKDDVDIAAMIKKLGNSDWVKQGRVFFVRNENYCPFCQQTTDAEFSKSLEEYFDDIYLQDIGAIDTLVENYETHSNNILSVIEGIQSAKPTFLDCEELQAHKIVIEARIIANKQHIARKKKEPSSIISLQSLKDILDKIAASISVANANTKKHNDTIDNLKKEKLNLTNQIWHFIVAEIKLIYDSYSTKKINVNSAISSLKAGITSLDEDHKNKNKEIQELEKKITSIKPTVEDINKLLLSFGFSSFSLAESEKKGFYKIVRPNGEDAKETLSEGEKTFITFLYFYHLLKGSNTESGIMNNRVVIFDDPVSSLDSDILFIVSNLIKSTFGEVRSATGQIKQVFVLTHNIYFHKEVSFDKYRSSDIARSDETFWIVKKHNEYSVLERHDKNPIKTSYELLWSEIRDQNRSSLTIQNVLRRILENYFKILGGIDNDEIIDEFEGKEKVICCSLMSWINDGSHLANDDLYVTCDDQTVDKFLDIFQKIFDKSGQLGHYNMMMGISEDSLQSDDVNDNIQLVEAEQ